MSSNRAHKHSRNFIGFGLFIVLAWVLAPTRVAADRKESSTAEAGRSLSGLHGTAGMKSDKGKSITVDPAKHAASSHGILGCTDCHTDIKDFPHPAHIAKVQCKTCHQDVVQSFSTSVHSLLGDTACSIATAAHTN